MMADNARKNNSRLRIWVIGRNYPTVRNRMCGSFELSQAKMLASHGHDVTYVALVFHPMYKAHNWGVWRTQDDGVRIVTLSRIWFPQRVSMYCDRIKATAWEELLEVVEMQTGAPDVIHLHFPTLLPNPRPVLEYARCGSRLVSTEHWTKVQSGRINSHEKRQLSECVARSDEFLAVGVELRDAIVRITRTAKEITVVPNVVTHEFRPSDRGHAGFRFIAVGRLVKVKQFDRVIKAFCESFTPPDDVSLEIVGDGPERVRLRSLINRLGAGERVRLLGELNRVDTAERMRESDCLVCYSRYETFGVPVIEAWATGLPVIASDAIGFKEYWKPGLGKLISKNNDSELRRSMIEIRYDINKYDSSKIAAYANEHFSESVVYSSLIKIYGQPGWVNDAH